MQGCVWERELESCLLAWKTVVLITTFKMQNKDYFLKELRETLRFLGKLYFNEKVSRSGFQSLLVPM